jgi:hypothetical protein
MDTSRFVITDCQLDRIGAHFLGRKKDPSRTGGDSDPVPDHSTFSKNRRSRPKLAFYRTGLGLQRDQPVEIALRDPSHDKRPPDDQRRCSVNAKRAGGGAAATESAGDNLTIHIEEDLPRTKPSRACDFGKILRCWPERRLQQTGLKLRVTAL